MNNNLVYDKSSKIIEIPDGIYVINENQFQNYTNLEEIIIPDTVNTIESEAFKGCTNLKKITLPKNLQFLNESAFEDCTNLEEITLPDTLTYIDQSVFKNCISLKHVYNTKNIINIFEYAFYNCHNLLDTIINENTGSIHSFAFYGCDKIKHIHIPKNVDYIGLGAFAYMNSLEKITVDPQNEDFFTIDDDTVLLDKYGVIRQYAINSKNEEFIVGYYEVCYGNKLDDDGNETDEKLISNQLVYNVSDYAFAGAHNLKKIYLPAEIESLGANTFYDCPNLKKLRIFYTMYGKSLAINIFSNYNTEVHMPFEEIEIDEGIETLCGKMSELFISAKNVIIPSTVDCISEEVFSKSSKLKRLIIPKKIKMIEPNTFYPEIELEFDEIGKIKAKDFQMLQTKTSDNYFYFTQDKGNVRIFSLKNGVYYVKLDDYDVTKINKDEISSLFPTSYNLQDIPEEIVMYIIKLLRINAESSRLLTNVWSNKELFNLFSKFASDCDYIENIAAHKTAKIIKEIIDTAGIHDEYLFSSLIMLKFSKDEIEKVIDNCTDSLSRFIRFYKQNEEDNIDVDHLINYCNLLEKYKRYDRFLYNPIFFDNIDQENQENLLKSYNKNIKRLLINSKTLTSNYGWNLNDLLNLCTVLGIFSDDEILSQKMSTFLTEYMFNTNNKNSITGDAIHTIFSDLIRKNTINKEFIIFFIENYDRLLDIERQKNGIIARISNSFEEISKTSTSHRGSQRHLKVTIEKCLDFFLAERFIGVTEKNKELASILKKYYSENYALKIGESIYEQSLKAPRNIFSAIQYDENGEAIYSYDENEDLKEQGNIYNYHWLPKQDYDNLILGKYCSCCAHILGAGAGIMRASMTLDCCQNLVIRNINDDIIAKMTIYVNRELGYAVYNTTEINYVYSKNANLREIYDAFIRGTKAFLEAYNKNNSIPITIVTIGEYRNQLKEYLEDIKVQTYDTPNYSIYGYYAGDKNVGTYDGDAKDKQLLVTKK